MNKLKLSNQAIGSVMLAVQNSFMAVSLGKPVEECDVVGMLSKFELEETADGLVVLNPPTVEFLNEAEDLDEEYFTDEATN